MKVKSGEIPALTVKSCHPEDLGDVNGNNVEAAGSSFGQESDNHLKKLGQRGERVERKGFHLVRSSEMKRGSILFTDSHALDRVTK